ncbi:hypothetical protein GQX74_004006 [Glossina fuscipes]|nr:hypothetical protein GQX74_004006 [Glossina fuscipes]
MTQHTQPVVAQQQQLQTAGVQTTTTTPTITTQSNNNNNHNSSNASNSNNNSNNQTTQTVSIQQPQMNNNNNNNTSNNNNYSNQTQTAATANIYNAALPSTNLYMSATAAASHGMSAHAQHGTMYPAMIPAPLSSNVFVNNVTANVNLHGWAHTVPTGTWVHPSASHYIHGDVPTEQGTPVMQSMPMSIPLTSANTMSCPVVGGNPNLSGISGGSRGSRRGQGRRGGGSSRRNDYNSQRHPPPAGSPAPQQAALTNNQNQDYPPQQQGQQQSSLDTQQLMSGAPPAYVTHPPYGGHQPQYQCAYPAFFAPQNPMMHAGQSTAVQQATGTPLYFSTMPFYNGAHVYNYGYILPPVMSPADYQYVPGEDVVGGPGEERQACPGEGGAMMWHQQPIYAEDYAMNPGDMHVSAGAGDDMNHTASSMGSAAETPSMLSPNYGPIYDGQLHEMQQQMGVMQIYDDSQLGQIQAMHPVVAGVQQMDEELSECAANSVAPTGAIQMVPAGAIIQSGSMPITSDGQMMHQHHQPQQQTSHPQQPNQLISVGHAVLPIEPSTPTAPLQQPSHFTAAGKLKFPYFIYRHFESYII